jgi:hypothetical protein
MFKYPFKSGWDYKKNIFKKLKTHNMTREEFIKYLDSSCWSREYTSGDDYWRYERDYANCIWDYLEVTEDKVIFTYEDMYWGGSSTETKEFLFEAFKYADENCELHY